MLSQRLRKSIVVQQRKSSTNIYNENIGEWVDFATLRAGVEPLSGKEMLKNGVNLAEQVTRIVIRYRADITTQMRILYNDKIYSITAIINPNERNIMLELMCTQGTTES